MMNAMTMNKKHLNGFSLVELLVAMVVGVIIMTGVFSLNAITRKTQKSSEVQMDMVADARFAIEMIAYDLRHAGMWGGTNKDSVIACRAGDTVCAATSDILPAATNDCLAAGNWYNTLSQPVFATNNANPYAGTCIPASEAYQAGTDVLDIRYADSNELPGLAAGETYIRSNFINGKAFVGTTEPLLPAYDTGDPTDKTTRDYLLHAYSYYISDFTDKAGDGIPSLRRVALVQGPELQNQNLVSGVVDFQVQFGEDVVGGDQIVDRYVNPNQVTNWQDIYAAKIWLLMRTDKTEDQVAAKTFTLAGTQGTYGGDGFRYFMVSSVVDLRNLRPE